MSPGGGIEPTFNSYSGLAEDVAYYGRWLQDAAFKKIGHLYPKAKLNSGEDATVMAYIWARTVKCPNPACGCQMPLISSFELSKKKGKEAYIDPHFCKDHFEYEVKQGICKQEGTVKRTGATCLHCRTPVPFDYIRIEGQNNRIIHQMMAIVAEGNNNREYIKVTKDQIRIAAVNIPEDIPNTDLPEKALSFRVQVYGMDKHYKLFTPRQLTALTTFSDLIPVVYSQIIQDSGNEKYAKAIITYLAFAIDKLSDRSSTIAHWQNIGDKIAPVFTRQAIPMTWDFCENNPFSGVSGSFEIALKGIVKVIEKLPFNDITSGYSKQFDASILDDSLSNIVVSTDPPYYDNVGYADLSDYHYVWLRKSLKEFYPEIFSTILVPKTEELIATPYRFNGDKSRADDFFEKGMFKAFSNIYKYSCPNIPTTIYYAYKQTDTNKTHDETKTASKGWEVIMNAIIRAGFVITGTWPMETERGGRSISNGTNALASSIVLVCRKRPQDAPVCSLRDFQKALSKELRPALQKMQSSSIAPVDLAQSAIGPGMAVFSRYSAVLRSDDTPVTIREALELINKEIDIVFNEQDQAFDAETRFCLTIFAQYGFNDMKFGEANTLANAKNTSVERVAVLGAVHSAKGTVYLYPIDELPKYESAHADCVWTLTHHLVKTILSDGIAGCVAFIAKLSNSHNLIHCKELSYRLYTACERAKNAKLAIGYNTLVTSWDEIMRGVSAQQSEGKQGTLEI